MISMNISSSLTKKYRNVFITVLRAVFLIAFSYILIYPLIYMATNALKSVNDYADPTVVWVPKYMTLANFEKAYMVTDYFKSLFNSVRYEVVAAIIEVFACSIYAYGLSRYKMRFKSIMIALLFITILVPDIMLIIPRMMTFKQLDLFGILGLFNRITHIDLRPNIVDTPLAFYLPSIFGVGLKGGLIIFIYMQFYKGLPNELEEAAWIDGAGPLKTYFKIILPSSGVVILTNFIFAVIWHWNDFLLAIMYTYKNRPLAVVINDIKQYIYLRLLQVDYDSGIAAYGIPLAACLLFIIPPLVLYMILQRKFIQSIDRVGIVG